MKRILGAVLLIGIVLTIGVILVIYAQGKRLNKDGKLIGVGIIQIDTTPNDAEVYINGKYKAKSDTNIENLEPGNYTIKIRKDRYHTWEKLIEVKEGFVTPLKVSLYLSNPSLTSLTFDGVYSPTLSPNRKFVAYGKQSGKETGIYVLQMGSGQFFFNNSTEPRKIIADTNDHTFSKAVYEWSFDSKSVLVQSQKLGSTESNFFLLDIEKLNENPEDITAKARKVKDDWLQKSIERQNSILRNFSEEMVEIAKDAKSVSFSEDNDSVLIIKKDNSAIVQDRKPSPAPKTKSATYNLPKADSYFWFDGDSKHLLSIEGNSLDILDSDGTNKFSLFTGDFDPNAVFGWSDASKIVISINLNARFNPLPNLYTIGLH